MRFYSVLTPSFLHRNPRNERIAEIEASQVTKSILSTDWLDGLRGVASFIVFLFHHSSYGHPGVRWSYGAKEGATSFLQLPIICLIHHGRSMIAIFFVISGYALSFSPLQSIHNRDYNRLHTRLSSSIFRRGIRLMVPSIISAFLHYFAHKLGDNKKKNNNLTFLSDTTNFLVELKRVLSPFSWTTRPASARYTAVLWTIPVEFRASLILYVTVLGLSRSKCSIRMATITGLFFYCMTEEQWDVALFMAGILLAEANILQQQYRSNVIGLKTVSDIDNDTEKYRPESTSSWTIRKPKQMARNAGLISLLIAGCYFSSYPTKGPETAPVFMWMHRLGPKDAEFKSRFWTALGAVMITTSISFMPRCQAVFETDLIRYLGRISYSLYLTHGVMNKLLGKRIQNFMWDVFGKDDWIRYEGAWLLATIVYIPFVIWLADIFWRLVDIKVVCMAKNIERRCLSS